MENKLSARERIERIKIWNKITIEQFPGFVRFVAIAFLSVHVIYFFLMYWAGMGWFAFLNFASIFSYLELIRFTKSKEGFKRVYINIMSETIGFVSIMVWTVNPYPNIVWLMLPLLPFAVLMKYYFVAAGIKARISYRVTAFIIIAAFVIDSIPKYIETPKYIFFWDEYIFNVINLAFAIEIFASVAILCAGMTMILTNTQIKERELFAEAQELQEIAESASRAKTEFLSSMSHEIRTPLNGVLGMNEMILATSQDESVLEYARVIDSSGQMLLSLINDILDISRVEAGRMEIVEGEYYLTDLVRESFATVATKIAEKELKSKVVVDENLPNHLMGDSQHLKQILVNILSNAVKYTPAGDVSYLISGTVIDDQVELHFKIADTGIGMTQENISKIFDKFERFDAKKNQNVQGTGLGMSIVKNLVDLMGAELTIDSVYEVGSTFEVIIKQGILNKSKVGKFEIEKHPTIPEKPKPSIASQDNALEPKVSFTESDDNLLSKRVRLLCVDDMAVNLAVFQAMLKNEDVYIDTATGGMEALEKMRFKDYDIIFMDHMMPDMDGVETAKRMKAEPSIYGKNVDAPIIMLTANAISGMREQYLEQGFTDYISKPIKADDLKKTIEKYCLQKS